MRNTGRAFSDPLYEPDSIIALLGKLNVSRFPWEERIAVATCQARAVKERLRIYAAQLGARRLKRLQRVGPTPEPSWSLSSYLVNRGDAGRT